MRITTGLSSGRAQYYDRNPTDTMIGFFNTGLAPAGNTVRATYTAPAARKASLESAATLIHRATAATTASFNSMFVVLQPGGVGSKDVCSSMFNNNVVDSSDKSQLGAIGVLLATDVVSINTDDLSTGGTTYVDSGVKITEYDA